MKSLIMGNIIWVILGIMLFVVLLVYEPAVFSFLLIGGMGYMIAYDWMKRRFNEKDYDLYVTTELLFFVYNMNVNDRKCYEHEFYREVVCQDEELLGDYKTDGIKYYGRSFLGLFERKIK